MPLIKRETAEVVIVRKRASSNALNTLKSEAGIDTFLPRDTPSAPVRMKLEDSASQRAPLKFADREQANITPVMKPDPGREDHVEDIRSQLTDIQSTIFRLTNELRKAQDKRKKTKADLTRIARLAREISELNASKARLNATIPTNITKPAPSMPQPVASGSNVQLPPAFQNPQFPNPNKIGRAHV